MPEIPDLTVYIDALTPRVIDQPIESIRVVNPFVLRSVDPPLQALIGQPVGALRRLGKRVVLALGKESPTADPEDRLFIVLHLMIAGRLHWRKRGVKLSRGTGLMALDFPTGALVFTEAGTRKRAWLRAVRGEESLADLDPGGLEPLEADLGAFCDALQRENRTLKRALTDPHILSGIGNAYSDEILHEARLSPVKLTHKLTDEESARLFAATQSTLQMWIERLRAETGDGFPAKVTAFRPEMAVHGKYNDPCPVCEAPVQRIVRQSHETNYCPTCQTGGKLLADRALSRLPKKDWPASLEALEMQIETQRVPPR